MTPDTVTPPTPKAMLWSGRVISTLVILLLVFSGVMKVMKAPQAVEGFKHFGFSDEIPVALGIVELACAVLYAIPQTSVLGAILLAGYFGGAIATHVRMGEPFVGPLVFGVLPWIALWLRDARVRALAPWRK